MHVLPGHLAVSTCIACGARSRAGECADGCEDVPLDLVDVAHVEAAAARLEALEERILALRGLAELLAAGSAVDLDAARSRALELARLPAAPAATEPDVVQAWGCPDCGRIDAPQPCLGVCVRRPVLMADASEQRVLAARATQAAEFEQALASLARLVAHVTPRAGAERRTWAALAARARSALSAEPAR
jgi:hypothetical protein